MQSTLNNGSWGSNLTRGTSIQSYIKLLEGDENTQINILLKTYLEHEEGLTDCETQQILRNKGIFLDKARISGRRYDINKKYGGNIIVNVNNAQRKNKSGRTALIWSVNKYGLEKY